MRELQRIVQHDQASRLFNLGPVAALAIVDAIFAAAAPPPLELLDFCQRCVSTRFRARTVARCSRAVRTAMATSSFRLASLFNSLYS